MSDVGPGTLRALCLIAEITYGAGPGLIDPVRYGFVPGSKDGFPFPVSETDIEQSYNTLKHALRKAEAGQRGQLNALKNLALWYSEAVGAQAKPIIPPPRNGIKPAKNISLHQPGLFD